MQRLALTNRWAVLALLFFARASMAAQFQSVPPISTLLIEDLSLNYTQLGVLMGLFMFPGIVLSLPSGLLGRRFGDKALLLTGLGLQALGSLLMAHAETYPVAVVARSLGGVGLVLLQVQFTKVVVDLFSGKEIATAMAILMTAWPFGFALALSTLGAVAEAWSWAMALNLTTLYSLLSFVAIGLFLAPQPVVRSGKVELGRLWVISGRELVLIILAVLPWMLFNVGFVVFISFAPVLLVGRGVLLVSAGLLVSVASWISIGSIPLGGLLTDRTGRINLVIVAGATGMVAALWALPMGGTPLLWVVLLGIAIGLPPGAIMSLPGQVLSPEARSTGLGVFYTVYYLGMALLLPVAGWLQDSTGSAAVPLYFGGGLAALAVVTLGLFRLAQRRVPQLI